MKHSRTYRGNVHVLAPRSTKEEVDPNAAFDHLGGNLPKSRMLGLEKLLFGIDSVQIIFVP